MCPLSYSTPLSGVCSFISEVSLQDSSPSFVLFLPVPAWPGLGGSRVVLPPLVTTAFAFSTEGIEQLSELGFYHLIKA
jgi:hypothetical protein